MQISERANTITSINEDGTPGCYSLRELIRGVPLSTDEDGAQAHITCIDAWNRNLYIGTSSGEILHYVSIPAEPSDGSGQPVYIFATRIEPPYTAKQTGPDTGVKQILLLPSAGKACIVCNSTLTFYTLPELSPAWEGKYTQSGCLWVGGLDRNHAEEEHGKNGCPVVVICLRARLRLIRFSEQGPRKIPQGDIELGRITLLERRGDLACVSDGQAYSLLDVVNQRKNELFPISWLVEPKPLPAQEEALTPPAQQGRPPSANFSSRSPAREGRSHQRITSLGGQRSNKDRLQPDIEFPWPARRSSRPITEPASPASPKSRKKSPIKADENAAPRPSAESQRPEMFKQTGPLQPNILSPSSSEFLLTTGTKWSDRGVGMFVNLDGDVVRDTMDFSSYPESLVLDNVVQEGMPPDEVTEGHILAFVRRRTENKAQICIEIQRWDVDPDEAHRTKQYLTMSETYEADPNTPSTGVGLRNAKSAVELTLDDISFALRLRRLKLKEAPEDEVESKRTEEEDKLASRFSQVRSNVLHYSGDRISGIVREPLLVQLDKQLGAAMQKAESGRLKIDVLVVQRVVNSIRGQNPRDELEFLTLTYVRQKASLLLFGNLVMQTASRIISYEHDKRRAEDALTSGEVDPRIVLALVFPLDDEIVEGDGIWIPQGLRDTVTWLREGINAVSIDPDIKGAYGDNMLKPIKRYLMVWRRKKGFGSVADEAHVFYTVDAALLRVLLMLDGSSPRGSATPGSCRAELNHVVENGVDCFDRAVELFEKYHRLYVLSRLYQSKTNAPQVLATWRRILGGEEDAGGELVEGEQDGRKYLRNIGDAHLVQEYGSWLANRNPELGVQVFADDTSKVRFDPQQAIAILKQNAPRAVKGYLEHLVFGKNNTQFVNDLIACYLDTVLAEIEGNSEARNFLLDSYKIYRTQHPPKPTYSQFITDQPIEAEWWQNRMRLLQLIGGSHGAALKSGVQALRKRLAPYSDELVLEVTILNAREKKHAESLRLLIHGLGDYDTAIRYCLSGGSSIFMPIGLRSEEDIPTHGEQSVLFNCLLNEFFKIEDPSERLERTAGLLERFTGRYDLAEVLERIPDSWSVDLVSGFLVRAFRCLITEKNETVIAKALCSAQNLKKVVEVIETLESTGLTILRDDIPDAVGSGT